MQQLSAVNPRKEATAGKRLPYAPPPRRRTIETRDGMLMQVIHLAGLPFETADSEELNYRKAVRDVMLRGSGQLALRRLPPHRPPPGFGPDARRVHRRFSQDLDAAWGERLALASSM
jgi:type IV secretion system protein VirB4